MIGKKLNISEVNTIKLDGAEAERNGNKYLKEELMNSLLNKYIDDVER